MKYFLLILSLFSSVIAGDYKYVKCNKFNLKNPNEYVCMESGDERFYDYAIFHGINADIFIFGSFDSFTMVSLRVECYFNENDDDYDCYNVEKGKIISEFKRSKMLPKVMFNNFTSKY